LLVSFLADIGICRFLPTLEAALAALLRVVALLLRATGLLTLGLAILFGLILLLFLHLFLFLDLQCLRGLGAGLVGAEVTLLFLLLGLFILGFVLSRVAISLVLTRFLWPLHGLITIEEPSCGGSCSQIVLIVVDGLDFETFGSVGLEGREAAVCTDLEEAGFTLR
jgi:hypothetical protein